MTSPLALTLHLAPYTQAAALSPASLSVLEERLSESFRTACNGNLNLTIRRSGPPEERKGSIERFVHARELHDFALQLNGNAQYWGVHRTEGPPVHAIAALFAEFYAPAKDVLGVMFDRGFETDDDGNSSSLYTGVPREACAIFTGAAREIRRESADADDEIWFTTTHELGHVFNLQHSDDKTYMSRSRASAPYHWSEVDFSSHQKLLLSQCNVLPQVWPGGSDFGDASQYGHYDVIRRPVHRGMDPGVRLEIQMTKSEFYACEPVELEVSIQVSASRQTGLRLPDCIDPGYEQFRIFIEEPNGEKRLYRSPRIYCQNPAQLRLRPGEVFRRDISIFGQAGGYTFRSPGEHKLVAELNLKRSGILRSNDLAINVLPYAPNRVSFQRIFALFGGREKSSLLYHRCVPSKHSTRLLKKVTQFCDDNARWQGVELLRYAIGRAWLTQASKQKGTIAKRSTALGREQLSKALRRSNLGTHRSERAERLLSKTSGRLPDLVNVLWDRKRVWRN